jgi:thioredoxin 1
MAVRAVSSLSDLLGIVKSPKLTVVDLYATWCGPCMNIAPRVHDLAMKNPQVAFVKVDVDQAGDIAQEYSVSSLPTFLFFRGGSKVESMLGADYNKLEGYVKSLQPKEKRAIPADAALSAMSGKELKTIMAEYSISSQGMLEKAEFVDALKARRSFVE